METDSNTPHGTGTGAMPPIRHASLSDNKLLHVRAVAEVMWQTAVANGATVAEADGMYLLGLVHDIGYLHGARGHSDAGGDILEASGYRFSEEVRRHGRMTDDPSRELVMLWHADMSCDHLGRRVTYEERLDSIVARYGDESSQARNARAIIGHLRGVTGILLP